MTIRTALIAVALLAPVPFASGTETAQPVAVSAEPAAVLDVSALMREPDKHKGVVRIEGVVSRVYPKDQKLGLIDTEEFKRCGVVTCADMVLPVRWTGVMPEPKAHVRLDGEVQKSDRGLEFVANSLETVPAQ